MSDLEKLARAIEARAAKAKNVGAGRVSILEEDDLALSQVVEAVPTGLEVLDRWVLGCGGWPVGRISELFAEESLGKSSLVLRGLARAQQAGGVAALVENERSFDRSWATFHGVDVSKLILLEPDTTEQALTVMEATIREIPTLRWVRGPSMVGWDSLAAATPEAELEGTIDQQHLGVRARLLNQGFRKLGTLCARSRVALVVVNQVRYKIGVKFGDPRVTPGGNALKHHASIRVSLLSGGGGAVKDGPAIVGRDVTAVSKKNKLCPPGREAVIRLRFDTGWDDDWSVLELAKEHELVRPKSRSVEEARTILWDPERGIGRVRRRRSKAAEAD